MALRYVSNVFVEDHEETIEDVYQAKYQDRLINIIDTSGEVWKYIAFNLPSYSSMSTRKNSAKKHAVAQKLRRKQNAYNLQKFRKYDAKTILATLFLNGNFCI